MSFKRIFLSVRVVATIALGLGCGSECFSQALDVAQYGHTAWTAEEGAFQGSVQAVGQTTDGYLWLGTGFGLLRFDGVRFVSWKVPDGQSLPKSPILKVLGTSDGSLWIGGYPGLARLRDGKLKNYHELDLIGVASILEDPAGTIWAGGVRTNHRSTQSLCRIEQERVQCFGDEQFLGGWVHSLYQDRQGRIWAATEKGIWQLQPGTPRKVSDVPVTGIAEDRDGDLILATPDNLSVLEPDGKLKPFLSMLDRQSIKPMRLIKDRDGDLWISTHSQGILHIHDGRIDSFTVADGLTGNVYDLFQDHEGNVWTPTLNGLDRFRRLAIPVISQRQGLSSNVVNSIVASTDSSVWIGTEDGLNRMNGVNFVHLDKRQGLPNTAIQSLLQTSRGGLLISTNLGLGLLRGAAFMRISAPATGNANFSSMAEDARGDLWVLSHTGLMHLNDDGALIETISYDTIRIHALTLTYDPGRDGIWITGARGELGLLKEGKVVSRYGEKDGLGGGMIRDAQVFPDGSIWVSTEVGLARLKDGKFSFLGKRNGLPCDAIQWMRADDEHTVWLDSECGLIRISEAELNAWAAQPNRQVDVLRNFDNTDGAANIALGFWYTPQVARASDGRILFLTAKGIGVIDPKNLRTNMLPPPVHIEEVTADGRTFNPSGLLMLPKHVRELRIAYTALSLAIPQKVRFRYQLEGYDRGWSLPTAARQMIYTNLPPGHYTFRVIAANNSGVWNNDGTSIDFRVPPAFAQTLWYPLMWIVVGLLLVAAVFYWRLRAVTAKIRERMAARLAERERIARELHDTLLQGFQGLVVRFQAVADAIPEDQPTKPMMSRVLDRADEILIQGRDRVRDLRSNETIAGQLAEDLQELADELQGTNSTAFELRAIGMPCRLSSDVQEELLAIGKEALTNAFRHSGASLITCELIFEPKTFALVCRDDGMGISEEVLVAGGREGHWGLLGMEERAKNIGGTLRIQSGSSKGSSVEVRLSARIAYRAAAKTTR